MEQYEQEGMTRTQKRKLRKKQIQKVKKRKQMKKKVIKWGGIALTVLLALGAVYEVFFSTPDLSHAGLLRLGKAEYNFGFVHISNGTVDTDIPLVNIGEGALTIRGLESSCGCTTARIVNNGAEGPIFGMAGHGRSPKNWQTTINPGEQAVLKIYYNPTTHPDLRGPVTRIVTITSDDPKNPTQEIKIMANQIE